MRFNKRGELGFPEAIMAVMIVTLSLSAYLGLFALNAANSGGGPDVHIDHRIFDTLVVSRGEVTGDIEMMLVSEAERHGYRGVSVICEVPGGLGVKGMSVRIGDMDGSIGSERFLCQLRSADGRALPAVIEVAVCV
ncbi:MAG: hypothetical protein FWH47_06335 [Methanomassiliicoccaceae archaeon]|nr:hypothetical protein [Methanomassiliicoccaceae archaeon]